MFRIKLKAGALQFTLFISIVIALLLIAFILFVQTHKRFTIQTNFIKESINNSNNGIKYTLLNTVKLNDTTAINLNDENYKSLKVYRDFWGIFEKTISISKIKTNTYKKVALLGATQLPLNRTALHLKDNNKPLVIVGNTKIAGLAYLPKSGIKSGSISGQSYYGTQLIYGSTKESTNFPQLNKELLYTIKTINTLISKTPQSQYINLEAGQQYSNSFINPVQVIFKPSTIHLNNTTISGHIIVKSKTKIIVDNTSTLKDVILIAPKIEIRQHVKGNFQAIASEEIIMQKNCTLNYPSALVVIKKQETKNKSTTNKEIIPLKINTNSTIKGVVIYFDLEQKNNYNIQLSIAEGTKVYGEVFCNDNLELNGSVFGTVYTNNFTTKKAGSIYQNHIYNGQIIVDSLNTNYIGLPFKNSKKGILQWLY